MRIPVITGIIDRRILVNYRVDPQVIARVLPTPFRPKLHESHAIAGICLIRLRGIRPRGLPGVLGISSENAAHRIAVEWDTPEGVCEGVYIPRRDTSSRLNTLVGGRLFPGVHHRAAFRSIENGPHYRIEMQSDDGQAHLKVKGVLSDSLPQASAFRSLAVASAFFERGSLGYSATRTAGAFDGLELRTLNWSMQPLAVDEVRSSFFDDQRFFPAGSAEFDCALVMREVRHEWHGRERMCCGDAPQRI